MSDTTQYPNGIYEFTGTDPRGHDHWHNVVRVQSGWLEIMGDDWTCRVEDCKVRYLTPLVPSTELDAARQRIADLEAEVARLRAEPTEPTLDEMILAISECKLPFVLQGWGRTWWVDYWDNRTVDQPTPSEAIRAAWEAVCKESQP